MLFAHQRAPLLAWGTILGGSWVVISVVKSIRGLISLLLTTHEPSSSLAN